MKKGLLPVLHDSLGLTICLSDHTADLNFIDISIADISSASYAQHQLENTGGSQPRKDQALISLAPPTLCFNCRPREASSVVITFDDIETAKYVIAEIKLQLKTFADKEASSRATATQSNEAGYHSPARKSNVVENFQEPEINRVTSDRSMAIISTRPSSTQQAEGGSLSNQSHTSELNKGGEEAGAIPFPRRATGGIEMKRSACDETSASTSCKVSASKPADGYILAGRKNDIIQKQSLMTEENMKRATSSKESKTEPRDLSSSFKNKSDRPKLNSSIRDSNAGSKDKVSSERGDMKNDFSGHVAHSKKPKPSSLQSQNNKSLLEANVFELDTQSHSIGLSDCNDMNKNSEPESSQFETFGKIVPKSEGNIRPPVRHFTSRDNFKLSTKPVVPGKTTDLIEVDGVDKPSPDEHMAQGHQRPSVNPGLKTTKEASKIQRSSNGGFKFKNRMEKVPDEAKIDTTFEISVDESTDYKPTKTMPKKGKTSLASTKGAQTKKTKQTGKRAKRAKRGQPPKPELDETEPANSDFSVNREVETKAGRKKKSAPYRAFKKVGDSKCTSSQRRTLPRRSRRFTTARAEYKEPDDSEIDGLGSNDIEQEMSMFREPPTFVKEPSAGLEERNGEAKMPEDSFLERSEQNDVIPKRRPERPPRTSEQGQESHHKTLEDELKNLNGTQQPQSSNALTALASVDYDARIIPAGQINTEQQHQTKDRQSKENVDLSGQSNHERNAIQIGHAEHLPDGQTSSSHEPADHQEIQQQSEDQLIVSNLDSNENPQNIAGDMRIINSRPMSPKTHEQSPVADDHANRGYQSCFCNQIDIISEDFAGGQHDSVVEEGASNSYVGEADSNDEYHRNPTFSPSEDLKNCHHLQTKMQPHLPLQTQDQTNKQKPTDPTESTRKSYYVCAGFDGHNSNADTTSTSKERTVSLVDEPNVRKPTIVNFSRVGPENQGRPSPQKLDMLKVQAKNAQINTLESLKKKQEPHSPTLPTSTKTKRKSQMPHRGPLRKKSKKTFVPSESVEEENVPDIYSGNSPNLVTVPSPPSAKEIGPAPDLVTHPPSAELQETINVSSNLPSATEILAGRPAHKHKLESEDTPLRNHEGAYPGTKTIREVSHGLMTTPHPAGAFAPKLGSHEIEESEAAKLDGLNATRVAAVTPSTAPDPAIVHTPETELQKMPGLRKETKNLTSDRTRAADRSSRTPKYDSRDARVPDHPSSKHLYLKGGVFDDALLEYNRDHFQRHHPPSFPEDKATIENHRRAQEEKKAVPRFEPHSGASRFQQLRSSLIQPEAVTDTPVNEWDDEDITLVEQKHLAAREIFGVGGQAVHDEFHANATSSQTSPSSRPPSSYQNNNEDETFQDTKQNVNEDLWQMSLAPHNQSLAETLIGISRQLITFISNDEVARERVIDDYASTGNRILDDLEVAVEEDARVAAAMLNETNASAAGILARTLNRKLGAGRQKMKELKEDIVGAYVEDRKKEEEMLLGCEQMKRKYGSSRYMSGFMKEERGDAMELDGAEQEGLFVSEG